jgi:hypothetical protein
MKVPCISSCEVAWRKFKPASVTWNVVVGDTFVQISLQSCSKRFLLKKSLLQCALPVLERQLELLDIFGLSCLKKLKNLREHHQQIFHTYYNGQGTSLFFQYIKLHKGSFWHLNDEKNGIKSYKLKQLSFKSVQISVPKYNFLTF